ncbi:4Fe-4S dicluster domain-containing protein [Chloroflexota bacterium]
MAQVVIDKEKCDGCGYCVNDCLHSVLALDANGKVEVVKPEACAFCRDCVNNCPCGALDID